MVTFMLKDKRREVSNITMLVTFSGMSYKRSVKLSAPVALWNGEKRRVRVTAKAPAGQLTNDLLNKWEVAGLRAITHFKEYPLPPSKEEFFKVLDREFYKEDPSQCREEVPLFTDYMRSYIERFRTIRNSSTVLRYGTRLNKLLEFESHYRVRLRFEDIDMRFYNKFQRWFYDQGYTDNYFGAVIKFVKQVFRESRAVDKLHNFDGIEQRGFQVVSRSVGNIYLTDEELHRMHELIIDEALLRADDLKLDAMQVRQKVEALDTARNLFLIGAYTGLRVSDFGRLKDAHFDGDFIRILTSKTKEEVVIPIHPIIRRILGSGFDLSIERSAQKINKQIKEVGRLAGITEEVILSKYVAGEAIEVSSPKYELICTHTARRSFATNTYKAGMDSIAIMKMTSHKKESTFLKYIKVSNEENAEILRHHPFFSGD